MCREAVNDDVQALSDLFWDTVSSDISYVSHGELQMGIAEREGVLAADGKRKWQRYIVDKISAPTSRVFVAEDDGAVRGFVVVEIASDGDLPFGVICDLIVRRDMRGAGLGGILLDVGRRWLCDRGVASVYLESGVGNHNAHAFFERHGFRMVSHVFRLG